MAICVGISLDAHSRYVHSGIKKKVLAPPIPTATPVPTVTPVNGTVDYLIPSNYRNLQVKMQNGQWANNIYLPAPASDIQNGDKITISTEAAWDTQVVQTTQQNKQITDIPLKSVSLHRYGKSITYQYSSNLGLWEITNIPIVSPPNIGQDWTIPLDNRPILKVDVADFRWERKLILPDTNVPDDAVIIVTTTASTDSSVQNTIGEETIPLKRNHPRYSKHVYSFLPAYYLAKDIPESAVTWDNQLVWNLQRRQWHSGLVGGLSQMEKRGGNYASYDIPSGYSNVVLRVGSNEGNTMVYLPTPSYGLQDGDRITIMTTETGNNYIQVLVHSNITDKIIADSTRNSIDLRSIGGQLTYQYSSNRNLWELDVPTYTPPNDGKDWTIPFCQYSFCKSLVKVEVGNGLWAPNIILPTAVEQKGLKKGATAVINMTAAWSSNILNKFDDSKTPLNSGLGTKSKFQATLKDDGFQRGKNNWNVVNFD